jgi:anti-sigma-K factor RskA
MPATMSDEPTMDSGNGAPLAGEYVLGVLSAADRSAFEARMARDPALRAEVEYWEQRLGVLASEVESIDPPPHVWANIEAAIAPSTERGGLWQNLFFWRWATVGSAAVAATCLMVLAYIARVPTPSPPLIARLEASGGQASFVATVDPRGAGLTIVPAAVPAVSERALELWLIAPGEKPQSLGLIEPNRPVHIALPARLQSIAPQATLAVSLEPMGGSPTGQPTGPVIASGKLTNL